MQRFRGNILREERKFWKPAAALPGLGENSTRDTLWREKRQQPGMFVLLRSGRGAPCCALRARVFCSLSVSSCFSLYSQVSPLFLFFLLNFLCVSYSQLP